MAHARRYFEKALPNDKKRASHAMNLIQKLYLIERKARELYSDEQGQIDVEKRKDLRQDEALPILNQIKAWAIEEYPKVLPKSPIGKALDYYLQREKKLRSYINDGRLEIDNNLVENAIRPLALGRKNYLFAGSHNGAIRAAMIYSFIGSCEKSGVEPREWLKDVIKRINQHPVNLLHLLLPNNWKPMEK